MKKAFTIVEVTIVFVLLLLTAYLVVPSLLDDTKKAEHISQWKYAYHNIEYMFSAVGAQFSAADKESFSKAGSNEKKEQLLFEYLKPFLRVKSTVKPQEYKTSYLNASPVHPEDEYYFSNLYLTNSNNIIGLKWINSSSNRKDYEPILILLYDINGLSKPNRWGEDIFGVNIFRRSIEPFGKHIDETTLKYDCSRKGTGIYCSYYYYIYGSYIE